MNYNEENKIIAPLVWNNGKRELYDDGGNRLYTAEEVNQILNSEITPILNDRNWFAERCRILENYINQYITIGLNSAGNYNQIAAQQNKNNEFLAKLYSDIRKDLGNSLDELHIKEIDNIRNDIEILLTMIDKSDPIYKLMIKRYDLDNNDGKKIGGK